MTAPKVYRSTDPNGPVACATPQSLINILDACLVDGYGDLPGAGWTRPFASEDGTGAVYKQGAGGNGMYLKIFGVAELPAGIRFDAVGRGIHGAAIFESMTDYSNGMGRTPSSDTVFTKGMMPVASRPLQKATEDTFSCAWILIADSAFFYFFCWPTEVDFLQQPENVANFGFGAGSFIALNNDESCNNVIFAYASHSCCYGYFASGNYNKIGPVYAAGTSSTFNFKRLSTPFLQKNSNANIYVQRLASGADGCYPACLAWGGGPVDGAYDESLPLLVSRPYLADGAFANTLRGWLPGFYTSNYKALFQSGTIIEEGGKKFIAIKNEDFFLLIDIGDTFRP
ncbi:hypothetical protein CSA56_19130 [candidate division KSB3 bacterium]|uniref:Uncharacterized protein n=1 Tax=candidate division KSB3 bacterium TaxID=2044937 RepID=A0A2G6K681_9BACT|nr:MAG: hypothetical protein CSA56_19130 [candidate division KSB3 bacterium]